MCNEAVKSVDDEDRPCLFTETAAYLNDSALKAFIEGMTKKPEPTPALIETIRRSKSIRQV